MALLEDEIQKNKVKTDAEDTIKEEDFTEYIRHEIINIKNKNKVLKKW